MNWKILYHPDVVGDLEAVGPSAARRIIRTINDKLTHAPLQLGSGLTGNLASLRKLRVGDYRVVYRVKEEKVMVYVLTVGRRRDKEVYKNALNRIQ
jgi:mRNA interferase RelE/StbE